MTSNLRRIVLRGNAVYLGTAAIVSLFFMDIPGIFFGLGPEARIVATAPHTGIGFVEAHGLAFILSVLLWRAVPDRSWHVTGAAVSTLLGTCNLVFWQMFIAADALVMGYVTTSFHWTFAIAQVCAAFAASSELDSVARAATRRVVSEAHGR
jgi:hypothetical protein